MPTFLLANATVERMFRPILSFYKALALESLLLLLCDNMFNLWTISEFYDDKLTKKERWHYFLTITSGIAV